MTTFHEPPAQSRRAARQSERAEDAEGTFGSVHAERSVADSSVTTSSTGSPHHDVRGDTFPPASSTPSDMLTSQEDPTPDSSAPSGRRARARTDSHGLYDLPTVPPVPFVHAASPSSEIWSEPRFVDASGERASTHDATSIHDGEPLTYATQGAQHSEVTTSHSPRDDDSVAPIDLAEPAALSLAERLQQASGVANAAQGAAAPAFRVRDFSPEGGRRAARTAEAAVAEAPLSYHTQQAPVAPSQPEPVVEHSAPRAQEYTLTRRELRALQAEQNSSSGFTESASVPPLVEPEAPSTESTATALSNAMAEFDALARAAQEKEVPAPPSVTHQPPSQVSTPDPSATSETPVEWIALPEADLSLQEPLAPPLDNPFANPPSQPSVSISAPHSSEIGEYPRVSADGAQSVGSTDATSEGPDELTPQFVEPVTVEPSYASTAGHWSHQAALDDETQPFENTLSREVGRGHVSTATNALVLPTTSQMNDIASAINSTGEILVTGSITLPSALGRKGGDSRRYDDPDVDALFDAYDNELVATDSAPVSAIRAVSTHTSTHGVITANKPTGNRMLTVMMVIAGVMGVAVFGLLIAGFVFNIF
ncbi:MAG: hypothetical protein ACOH1J_01525 [Microbacteriaceae bacterium]